MEERATSARMRPRRADTNNIDAEFVRSGWLERGRPTLPRELQLPSSLQDRNALHRTQPLDSRAHRRRVPVLDRPLKQCIVQGAKRATHV